LTKKLSRKGATENFSEGRMKQATNDGHVSFPVLVNYPEYLI
jgi:hypothetical protein